MLPNFINNMNKIYARSASHTHLQLKKKTGASMKFVPNITYSTPYVLKASYTATPLATIKILYMHSVVWFLNYRKC
jgi:hypothetical protein